LLLVLCSKAFQDIPITSQRLRSCTRSQMHATIVRCAASPCTSLSLALRHASPRCDKETVYNKRQLTTNADSSSSNDDSLDGHKEQRNTGHPTQMKDHARKQESDNISRLWDPKRTAPFQVKWNEEEVSKVCKLAKQKRQQTLERAGQCFGLSLNDEKDTQWSLRPVLRLASLARTSSFSIACCLSMGDAISAVLRTCIMIDCCLARNRLG